MYANASARQNRPSRSPQAAATKGTVPLIWMYITTISLTVDAMAVPHFILTRYVLDCAWNEAPSWALPGSTMLASILVTQAILRT